jgi:hypothetical protein
MANAHFKTRSILIANRDGNRLYTSPGQIPPDLRRPLEQALEHEWATTIVIADENGREEALKRLHTGHVTPQQAFPYARHAALAGLGAFLTWVFLTLR